MEAGITRATELVQESLRNHTEDVVTQAQQARVLCVLYRNVTKLSLVLSQGHEGFIVRKDQIEVVCDVQYTNGHFIKPRFSHSDWPPVALLKPVVVPKDFSPTFAFFKPPFKDKVFIRPVKEGSIPIGSEADIKPGSINFDTWFYQCKLASISSCSRSAFTFTNQLLVARILWPYLDDKMYMLMKVYIDKICKNKEPWIYGRGGDLLEVKYDTCAHVRLSIAVATIFLKIEYCGRFKQDFCDVSAILDEVNSFVFNNPYDNMIYIKKFLTSTKNFISADATSGKLLSWKISNATSGKPTLSDYSFVAVNPENVEMYNEGIIWQMARKGVYEKLSEIRRSHPLLYTALVKTLTLPYGEAYQLTQFLVTIPSTWGISRTSPYSRLNQITPPSDEDRPDMIVPSLSGAYIKQSFQAAIQWAHATNHFLDATSYASAVVGFLTTKSSGVAAVKMAVTVPAAMVRSMGDDTLEINSKAKTVTFAVSAFDLMSYWNTHPVLSNTPEDADNTFKREVPGGGKATRLVYGVPVWLFLLDIWISFISDYLKTSNEALPRWMAPNCFATGRKMVGIHPIDMAFFFYSTSARQSAAYYVHVSTDFSEYDKHENKVNVHQFSRAAGVEMLPMVGQDQPVIVMSSRGDLQTIPRGIAEVWDRMYSDEVRKRWYRVSEPVIGFDEVVQSDSEPSGILTTAADNSLTNWGHTRRCIERVNATVPNLSNENLGILGDDRLFVGAKADPLTERDVTAIADAFERTGKEDGFKVKEAEIRKHFATFLKVSIKDGVEIPNNMVQYLYQENQPKMGRDWAGSFMQSMGNRASRGSDPHKIWIIAFLLAATSYSIETSVATYSMVGGKEVKKSRTAHVFVPPEYLFCPAGVKLLPYSFFGNDYLSAWYMYHDFKVHGDDFLLRCQDASTQLLPNVRSIGQIIAESLARGEEVNGFKPADYFAQGRAYFNEKVMDQSRIATSRLAFEELKAKKVDVKELSYWKYEDYPISYLTGVADSTMSAQLALRKASHQAEIRALLEADYTFSKERALASSHQWLMGVRFQFDGFLDYYSPCKQPWMLATNPLYCKMSGFYGFAANRSGLDTHISDIRTALLRGDRKSARGDIPEDVFLKVLATPDIMSSADNIRLALLAMGYSDQNIQSIITNLHQLLRSLSISAVMSSVYTGLEFAVQLATSTADIERIITAPQHLEEALLVVIQATGFLHSINSALPKGEAKKYKVVIDNDFTYYAPTYDVDSHFLSEKLLNYIQIINNIESSVQ